jgi:hypothetical protein
VADGAWGEGNTQTDALLEMLELSHIWTRPYKAAPGAEPRDPSFIAAEAPQPPPPPPPPPSWLEQVREGLAPPSLGFSLEEEQKHKDDDEKEEEEEESDDDDHV